MNFDFKLMNAVYLSERWAYEDLLRFKNSFPQLWDDEREDQLNDELKHSRACYLALIEAGGEVNEDLNYSMQRRLYSQLFNFPETSSLSDLAGIHRVFEKRALWVFRTYQRVGSNSKFKMIFRNIAKDERDHNHQLKSVMGNSANGSLEESDHLIWRNILPKKFGPQIFSSSDLWSWYYGSTGL